MGKLTLEDIAIIVYKEYVENGYEEMWKGSFKIGDIAELGLIITEVSEAIEEIRNKKVDYQKVGIECADIIIRVLNFMTRKYLNPSKFIVLANQKNLKRSKLHGKDV